MCNFKAFARIRIGVECKYSACNLELSGVIIFIRIKNREIYALHLTRRLMFVQSKYYKKVNNNCIEHSKRKNKKLLHEYHEKNTL